MRFRWNGYITPSKKKDKYRTRNWEEYSRSLVNRGSITFWFSEDVIANWYSVERTGKPGRPDTYSDNAIRCGLMIKAVFRTALCALQGFVRSLIEGLGLDIVCPHYSVFSRRARNLRIPLRKLLTRISHTHVANLDNLCEHLVHLVTRECEKYGLKPGEKLMVKLMKRSTGQK